MVGKYIIAAALFVAACAAPYSLAVDDRAAISTRITSFERAVVAGNSSEILGVIPPRMITAIAAKAGLTEQTLRGEMAKATRDATRDADVIFFDIALDQATFQTTASDRPYSLIPTQTVIQVSGNRSKLQSNTSTLTLKDDGVWYLIRIDDARQIALLREVYPDFEGVTLPIGTTKVIH